MSYKDKDKQREANRKAQARFKAKGITDKGITNQGITRLDVIPQTIIDACGNEHLIDYEGRRKDWDRRGWLAKQYSIIKGFEDKHGKLTDAGRRYLGQATAGQEAA